MSLLNITNLNVVAIYADDLKKSEDFYSNVLGFEKVQNMDPGVIYYNKAIDLNIYIEGGKEKRVSNLDQFAATSLCFSVSEGVKKAFDILSENNIEIHKKYGDFEGEFAGFFFSDPSGNIVEIAGRP